QKFKTNPPPFDQLYQQLSGDILEGGQRLEDACSLLETQIKLSCAAMVDLALSIEYSAFDLYRTMAERTADVEAREAFLAIAQTEKAHMRVLARHIALCPNHENVNIEKLYETWKT
ncbi:MAG: ferritin family protein, partial [Desulfobacterales bacterium]